jgi:hypothetical protein
LARPMWASPASCGCCLVGCLRCGGRGEGYAAGWQAQGSWQPDAQQEGLPLEGLPPQPVLRSGAHK